MLPDICVDSGLEFLFSETWRCVIWSSDEDTVTLLKTLGCDYLSCNVIL